MGLMDKNIIVSLAKLYKFEMNLIENLLYISVSN